MLSDFFDYICCINLDRRTDRWAECQQEFDKHSIQGVDRISAVESPDGNPVRGCLESHILALKRAKEHQRSLILEDDFGVLFDDFNAKFDAMIGLVPNDWDMLYLGAHYQEKPFRRVNAHVIQNAGVICASSYAVTQKAAEFLLNHIILQGEIDTQYAYHHSQRNVISYTFQPRLMAQRPGYSDLQRMINEHPDWCMTDPMKHWSEFGGL